MCLLCPVVRQSACFFTIHQVSKVQMHPCAQNISQYISSILIPFSVVILFLLLLPFSAIFSNIMLFKSLHSKLCLPSLLSVPSLPPQYQNSFPLHHMYNDRLMAASAVPLSNNKVTSIGPNEFTTSLFTHRLSIISYLDYLKQKCINYNILFGRSAVLQTIHP